jgi:hypothetical protein
MTTASAALDEIPVFARAGTIIPEYPNGVMTLVNGSAAVPDETSVGDDRVVLAFLGAAGEFHEAGGLGYQVETMGEISSSAVTYQWNGAGVKPSSTDPAGDFVSVTGPGKLDVTQGGKVVARLTITGGAAARKLTLVIRH